MNIPRSLCLSIVTSCVMVCAVQAQRGKVQKPRSENRPSAPYLLGPGDVVDVRILDQKDLDTIASVDSDGNLSSLPFLEPIPAKCRSEREVQRDIAAAYGQLFKNLQVSVRTRERNSQPAASVYGAVRQNTSMSVLTKQRLNDVIEVAGGFTDRAAGTIQILHTAPVHCPEPGDEAAALPIDGTAIPLQIVLISDLQKGSVNPVIRPGDHVLVTEAEPVYVTGSVVSPGSIMMRNQLTLSRALEMVGGARKQAKLNEVRIYRRKPGSAAEQEILKVDFEAIKKNKQLDVFLKPYDVIDVSETGIFNGKPWMDLVISALIDGMRNNLSRPMIW